MVLAMDKGERGRSRRDYADKAQRLKILGADRRDRGAITPKYSDGFWKRPYATEKDVANERSDTPSVVSRKHDRDCLDRTDSAGWSPFSKGVRPDKDGPEHTWLPRRSFGHDRDGPSPRRTLSGSDCATGLKSLIRKEAGIDSTAKSMASSERDGFSQEESGRLSTDKAYAKERVGSERVGRSETARFSPRKSSRDWIKSSKAPLKIGFGSSRDASLREDAAKASPREREHSKESERFSPGKRQEHELPSVVEAAKVPPGEEKESFYREPSSSEEREELLPGDEKFSQGKNYVATSSDEVNKKSRLKGPSRVLGKGHDKSGEELEGQRHAGKHTEKGDLCKRSPTKCTSAVVRSEDNEENIAKLHIVKRLRSGREKQKRDYAAGYIALKETVLEALCGVERDVADTGKNLCSNLSADAGEEEGEAALMMRVKGTVNEGLESVETSIVEAQNATEGESCFEDSKMCDASSGFIRKSEMEEGEFDPEDDAVESSERMNEHETAPCTIGKTSDSDEKVGYVIMSTKPEHNVEENDDQRDKNFSRKEMVENVLLKETDEMTFQDHSSEGELQRLLVEQPIVDGARKIDDFQEEHTEVHEICENILDSERKSNDRTFDNVPLHLNEKDQEHMGLTLNLLLDSAPAGQVKEGGEGLSRTKDIYIENNDSCKELSLSLSMKTPVQEDKGRDGIFEGRKKEAGTTGVTFNENVEGLVACSMDITKTFCERQTQKRQKLNPFSLSLALPDTSARLASSCSGQVPGSPDHDKVLQSFGQTYTNSDGFTASLSFSHSHPFMHNPSCSLTHTSFDNQEYSCGSQQISQGNEISHGSWQAAFWSDRASYGNYHLAGLSQDRMKQRHEVPLYPKLLQSGHSAHVSNKGLLLNERIYEKVSSSQVSHGSQMSQKLNTVQKNTESKFVKGGEIGKPMLALTEHDRSHQEVRRPPVQSTCFQENYHMQTGVEHPTWGLKGVYSARDENVGKAKNLSIERNSLLEIVTEPVAIMARKLQEFPDSFHGCLKETVNEMLRNTEKRVEFVNFQKLILRRTDLTQENLLGANRTQLELLLALKTGMQAFLQPQCQELSDKALIEIFLHSRCRNFCCQASLPVDGCECRICSQKSGFCYACMCVVCSKFDIAGETCRWIGCNYCMHWCHTDCGIQEYIVPGPSIGTKGASGMQYHCIGCGLNSELYGFVKEVFTKFANRWSAETLAKELDCVRRIFYASHDMKGKQLCWKVEEMLQKLENRVDLREVCESLMQYFTEGNVEARGSDIIAAQPVISQGVPDHAGDAVWDAMLNLNSSTGNKVADLDKARIIIQNYDGEFEEKITKDIDLEYEKARKQAGIDELERASRIKHAEAKMFQLRADEAQQAAAALQKIMLAKSEKIDEDYTCKVIKLQLSEAEDWRRKRLEELHAFERAQQEYQSMKMRMEVDIKDLLKKMESAKRQLV